MIDLVFYESQQTSQQPNFSYSSPPSVHIVSTTSLLASVVNPFIVNPFILHYILKSISINCSKTSIELPPTITLKLPDSA